MKASRPVALIVLDGWGVGRRKKGNAIALARTPNFDGLKRSYPNTQLIAKGKKVGLVKGILSGSEVGHENLGAGRVVEQEIVVIDKTIRNGSFYKNKVLVKAVSNARKKKSKIHFIGLFSDRGVHAHIDHLIALLRLVKKSKYRERVYVHAILDGRDAKPKSAKRYVRKVLAAAKKIGVEAGIATVMGRYYGMDRNNRWKREHKAYDAMVNGKGRKAENVFKAIDKAYSLGETDEFVKPTVIEKAGVKKGDSVVFFNFRSDRARQLTKAFVQGRFRGFKRKRIMGLYFVCLTEYDSKIKAPVAFKPSHVKNGLGEWLSKKGLRQLRTAESEKYPHVCYFFSGGREKKFRGEDRVVLPSPNVKTYDLKPGMSAKEVTDSLVRKIRQRKYDFIILNYANGDMVGHTGKFKAAVKAVEIVDKNLGRVLEALKEAGGEAIITADHGNCEEMLDSRGRTLTAHTSNNVPCILFSERFRKRKLRKGALGNVSPTILQLMGIRKPKEMKLGSLIV